MTKRHLIIDTDTASDDAVAILMALMWEDVVVEAITIVSGNMPVEQGSINARYTVELCGKSTPIYDGCKRPLVKDPAHAHWFHGPDGMGGMHYPDPELAAANSDAVTELVRRFREKPKELDLVTLGPLTNIAAALRIEPRIAEWVNQCVVMGGAACTVGNVTPAAEFNIWCDPEAAHAVFNSGMNILMVGWEHCRGNANLTTDEMALCYSFKTARGDFAIDCNKHALDSSQNWLGDPGLGLPDPVAMAVYLDTAVCTKQAKHYVEVSLEGPSRGATIVDQLGVGQVPPNIDPHWIDKQPNINVCWEIDAQLWKETLYKTLK